MPYLCIAKNCIQQKPDCIRTVRTIGLNLPILQYGICYNGAGGKDKTPQHKKDISSEMSHIVEGG